MSNTISKKSFSKLLYWLWDVVRSPEVDTRDVRVLLAILSTPQPQTIASLSWELPLSKSAVEKSVRRLKRMGLVTTVPSQTSKREKLLQVAIGAEIQPKAQVRVTDIGGDDDG